MASLSSPGSLAGSLSSPGSLAGSLSSPGSLAGSLSDERRAFLLAGTRTGVVATVQSDGRPHAATVWFTVEGNDILFTTGDDTVRATVRPMATKDESAWADRLRRMDRGPVPPERREMRRLAAAARLVIDRLVATTAPADVIARAADRLEEASAELEGHPQGRVYEGFAESANAGDPRAFFDHSPMIGAANPLAPPLRLDVVDGSVIGHARFGAAYEGPPGAVHGGYVAAAFDEVLGMAQSLSGNPGMTGTLTIRYRRPTPLHTDLRFEARLDRQEGRKLFTSGRLLDGEHLCAEAEGLFISVDFARIAQMTARRDGSES